MKRLIYNSIAKLADESLELFWIAGLRLDENENWLVLCVFRGRLSQKLVKCELPIGMMPVLKLGIWFDQGLVKNDDEHDDNVEIVISNMADYDIITSADIPYELYNLPVGKTGTQRLFRYQIGTLQVLIPTIELLRSMFIHNRALAIALMRPNGIEQLYFPQAPGFRDAATIRFTKEMPASVIGSIFAQEFAWLVLDTQAREAWDSVQQLSKGQAYVMFQPPSILDSKWTFRGIRYGNQWLVLELLTFTGRRLPFNSLEYNHPSFRKNTSVTKGNIDVQTLKKKVSDIDNELFDSEINVDGDELGSTSYRTPKITQTMVRQSVFENKVLVNKDAIEVERPKVKSSKSVGKSLVSKRTKLVQVTTSERAGTAKIPPLEFKLLLPILSENIGDLEALDETVRHMRDMLTSVNFYMSIVHLKQGRAVSNCGRSNRAAMVVIITRNENTPIVLLDVERTGIIALSLMALHFKYEANTVQIENVIKNILDGWVDCGGHWSIEVERLLSDHCSFERIPKILIPRNKFEIYGKLWAIRLIDRLGLKLS